MEQSDEILSEMGIVTRVEGNVAWVNTESKLACSSCKVESSCGNGILEKYLAGKIFISKIDNRLDAQEGDQVQLIIPKASVTKASFLVYLLPLVLFFVGALIGQFVFESEMVAIIASFVCLGLSGLFLAIYNRKIVTRSDFVPQMVSKVSLEHPAGKFKEIKVQNL